MTDVALGRQATRAVSPAGLIDVGHPVRKFESMQRWVDHRVGLVERLGARSRHADDPSGPGGTFVFARARIEHQAQVVPWEIPPRAPSQTPGVALPRQAAPTAVRPNPEPETFRVRRRGEPVGVMNAGVMKEGVNPGQQAVPQPQDQRPAEREGKGLIVHGARGSALPRSATSAALAPAPGGPGGPAEARTGLPISAPAGSLPSASLPPVPSPTLPRTTAPLRPETSPRSRSRPEVPARPGGNPPPVVAVPGPGPRLASEPAMPLHAETVRPGRPRVAVRDQATATSPPVGTPGRLSAGALVAGTPALVLGHGRPQAGPGAQASTQEPPRPDRQPAHGALSSHQRFSGEHAGPSASPAAAPPPPVAQPVDLQALTDRVGRELARRMRVDRERRGRR